MKTFSFKNRGAVIKTIKEPKIKKRKWTFDRITYWLVILVIAFFAIRFAYNSINVIKGNGQIVFEKLSINFIEDIRIEEIQIREGQNITIGDTLFSYHIENNQSHNDLIIQQAQIKSKLSKELLNLDREISIKNAELKGFQKQLRSINKVYNNRMKMVILEVDSHSELQPLMHQKEIIKSKITILREEVSVLKELKKSYQLTGDELIAHHFPQKQLNHYTAKIAGLSGTMNFSNSEVCYRQQEVLTIHDPKKVQIRAYFGQNHAQHIKEGTIVEIQFPDGTYSSGKIVHSYISTYALPSEFQKKYEPTERTILVDIEPIDKIEAEIWKKFYLMDAQLIIKKFI